MRIFLKKLCVLIVLLGGGICRRNIQEGLPSVWLFVNLDGAQEDSQREEFNRNLKPKFHDRCSKFYIWFSLASGCCHKLSKATSTNFDVFLYILLTRS